MQYNTIQYNTIQCNTIQYNTIQYNTIQYNTIQYNRIQYNTIQYNAMQYIEKLLYNYLDCNELTALFNVNDPLNAKKMSISQNAGTEKHSGKEFKYGLK